MTDVTVRVASPGDASRMLTIYAPIVRETAISFEAAPPSVDEFRARIERGLERYPWLVAERHDEILGYAYASAFRARSAYRVSAETTIYLGPEARGAGVGRRLYRALLDTLRRCQIQSAIACVARPNETSEAFHQALGFVPCGVIPRAGFKLDAWHDLAVFHLPLQPDARYREPLLFSALPEPRVG